MYDRMFEQSTPIDIAFLGSSHTISGLDDSLIQSLLLNPKSIVNLGYCRLGRNLTYTFLKDLLKEKRPEMLLIEARENENFYSHPIFPYLATERDVLASYPFFNPDVFSDAFTALGYKLELLQQAIFHQKEDFPVQVAPFGYAASPDTASMEILNAAKIRRSSRPSLPKWKQDFYMTYPLHYLKLIGSLCKEHGVELRFIYIPSYGSGLRSPLQYKIYEQYGVVWTPPMEIFENPGHWFDDNHLNKAGGKALSQWVGEKLREEIKD